ncbi:uncharacterized protein L969DRAFT_87235 [Mixia osmundae IAM 14324]|nr:uncharacterized protein L969DRAFT_87235 [Mixia osmundae IAM 14324]KEI39292.1 hypothetical protein L969DRAFT_87235 [Mixia osmundae IAM 14324]
MDRLFKQQARLKAGQAPNEAEKSGSGDETPSSSETEGRHELTHKGRKTAVWDTGRLALAMQTMIDLIKLRKDPIIRQPLRTQAVDILRDNSESEVCQLVSDVLRRK